ncbi:class I SAM-dependent methyltransferase [Methylocystis heyeri]|uniref:Methyltransferase domain-containing protein n=1 Tax=Methylocystis heyeri TaxID=391905 RepID=A0A6B8KFW6_9HYPH|nr:class I SAM-dependent methyltransferase [Methylocystis heyeri]QGM45330.1 methyltransferase domain-containing protein [Methylocystis heyeri]
MNQATLFGHEANRYFAARPRYPDELFEWLSGLAPARELAWDCGAGSGQAALGLAPHFSKIVATDVDDRQLALAPRRPNIEYRRAEAEADLGLDEAVDLIACGCSIHWFNLPAFYQRASQALKRGGVIAAWTYDWPWTGSGAVDAVLRKLREDILGPFWGENSVHYFGRYRNLPFPFSEIEPPQFRMEIAGSREELSGFLATWSALLKFRQHSGEDALALFARELSEAWALEPPALPLRVPLHMRCGFKQGPDTTASG